MEITVHQNTPETGITDEEIKEVCRFTAAELQLDAESCSVIFVDDRTLAEMHGTYLKDPSVTDIITFNLGGDKIEGELYISPERAAVHAGEYEVTVREEICRLIIHGLLHLKGFEDSSENKRAEMKRLEDRLIKDYFKKM